MSDGVQIYHNPRCSKSRETLNLLKENGVEPDVVLYLGNAAGCGNRAHVIADAGDVQRAGTDADKRRSL